MPLGLRTAPGLAAALEGATRAGLYLVPLLALYVPGSLPVPAVTGRNFAFRIIVEALAVSWVGLLACSPAHRPRLTPVTAAAAVFLLVVAPADVLGVNPSRSFLSTHARMEGFVTILHVALFFAIALSVFRRTADWRRFIWWSAAVSAVVAAHGLGQGLGLAASAQPDGRVDATLGNPIYLAAYLMFHVYLLAFLALREARAWGRAAALGVVALQLSVIALTAARGVILAMAAATALLALVFAAYRPPGARWSLARSAAVGVILLGALAVGSVVAFRDTPAVREHRVLSRFVTLSVADPTVETRLRVWGIAWQGIRERPVLGWGQENFYAVFDRHFDPALGKTEPWFDRSHNALLDWAVHAGLLGAAAYLALIGVGAWSFWLAWRAGRLGVHELGVLGGLLLAYLLQNLSAFDTLHTYVLLFTTLGLAEVLARPRERGEPRPPGPALPAARRAGVAMTLAALVAAAAVYVGTVRPILTGRHIVHAHQAERARRPLGEVARHLRAALEGETFGSREAREELLGVAWRVAGTREAAAADARAFVEFAIAEAKALAAERTPEAGHLLFLGSLHNRAIRYGLAHGLQARVVLGQARALAPRRQQIHFELARTSIALGDFPEALACLERAVTLDPSFPLAHLNYALAAIAAGQHALAEREIAEYRRRGPRGDLAALQKLVQAYAAAGEGRRARSLVEEAIRVQPGRGELYAQYAAVLAALDDLDGAAAAARKAAELDPDLKGSAERFIDGLGSLARRR